MTVAPTNQLSVPRGTLTPAQKKIVAHMKTGWELVHVCCTAQYVFLRQDDRQKNIRSFRTFEILRDRGYIAPEKMEKGVHVPLHTTIYRLKEGV